MRHQLQAVADAQHGGAAVENFGIDCRTAAVVNARRAAGDDQTFAAGEFGGGSLAGAHFGIDAEFADLSAQSDGNIGRRYRGP